MRIYGIEITDDLWHRYWTDPLVYNLMNIVIGQQQAMREMIEEALKRGVEVGVDAAWERMKQLVTEVPNLTHLDAEGLRKLLEES